MINKDKQNSLQGWLTWFVGIPFAYICGYSTNHDLEGWICSLIFMAICWMVLWLIVGTVLCFIFPETEEETTNVVDKSPNDDIV